MSVLVSFTALGSIEPPAGQPSLNSLTLVRERPAKAPHHCGTAMELVTPTVGPVAVGYTFEPDDGGPVALPPVWRCRCGFQLDAWISASGVRPSSGAAGLKEDPSLFLPA